MVRMMVIYRMTTLTLTLTTLVFAHYLICHRIIRTEKSLWIALLLFWR